MSRKTLVYIALTMFMALAGLIAVQIYWTRSIFAQNEEYLNFSVNEAMQEVATSLEDLVLSEQMNRIQNHRRLMREIDSVNCLLADWRQRYSPVLGKPGGIRLEADGRYRLTDDPVMRVEWRDTVAGVLVTGSFVQADYTSSYGLSDARKDEIRREYGLLESYRDDLLYASRMIDNLLRTSWQEAPERELGRRVAPRLIDSLLVSALGTRQIRTRVEWGVFSTYGGKLVMQKSRDYGMQLLQSGFHCRLYPRQKTEYPLLLYLYFPDRLEFLVSQIWYLIVASVLLFALLIYTFSYTLVSIWKQKKLTEMKSDFINHVTHEIKTPVSTIALICESFDDPDVRYDEAGMKNVLHIIQHENQRLQSLSSQIIQISKMEKGDYFLNKTHFEMHRAIEEAVNNTGFQVMHNNGRIVTHLDAENDDVYGDRTHIVHIVSNLIDNANKYCTEKPLIEIRTFNVEGGLQIDVKDNGIGIAKSNQKKIFEKLYRVPTGNKHDVKGFGLGLSYVASIMRQHGGRVWVDSELKQGSVFHLFFPQENRTSA